MLRLQDRFAFIFLVSILAVTQESALALPPPTPANDCHLSRSVRHWSHPKIPLQLWISPEPLEFNQTIADLTQVHQNAGTAFVHVFKNLTDSSATLEQSAKMSQHFSAGKINRVLRHISNQKRAFEHALDSGNFAVLKRANLHTVEEGVLLPILDIDPNREHSVLKQMQDQQALWVSQELLSLVTDLKSQIEMDRPMKLQVIIELDSFLSASLPLPSSLALLRVLTQLGETLRRLEGDLTVSIISERWNQWRAQLEESR